MSEENNENQEEESFPLEKILKTSIKDYCNSESVKIKDYKLVGVHVVSMFNDGKSCGAFNMIYFAKRVPENAEIVVDFQYLGKSEGFPFKYAYGTALIRKEEKEE